MYCPRCGTRNDDGARFCKRCGHDLMAGTAGPAPQRAAERHHDEDCERDCMGSDREQAWFWGVMVIIIGAWVVWNLGLKNVVDVPGWAEGNDLFCLIIWVVIGIAIIAAGLRMIARRR